MTNREKVLVIFGAGLIEQLGYTLYILSVTRYLILVSSILMFAYMVVYLLIMKYAIQDKTNSLGLLITYALASGVGNYLAMVMHIIK